MIRTLVDWAPGRHPLRTARENAPACAYSIPSTLRPLLVAGVLSLLAWLGVYILFFSHSLWDSPSLVPDRWPSFFYPIEKLFPGAWVHAEKDTPLGRLNVACWLALVGGLVALWVWALRVLGAAPSANPRLSAAGMRIVLGGLLAFSLLLIFSPGLTSQDLYSNIWYSKMAGVFGLSPFTHAPSDFAGVDTQGWLQWVYWKDQPCVYGPAWVLPAAGLGWLAQHIDGDIVTYLLAQRGMAAALHLANTMLVWNVAGMLWPQAPGRRLQAALFYGWCPLVVWEFANNAHNDVLLVFWVLIALWCHLKGVDRAARHPGAGLGAWWLAAVAALTLAGLTKLTGFLLVPAYVVLLWRMAPGGAHSWRGLAGLAGRAAALALGLSALLYLPYWDGWATLHALLDAPGNRRYANSLGTLLRYGPPDVLQNLACILGLTDLGGLAARLGPQLDAWVRPVLLATTALIGAVATWRVRDHRSLVRGWGWVLAAYLLMGAVWLWPWYLTWVIPLAALSGPSRLRALLIVSAAAGMVFYVR